ncbi:MAG: hypothetical protein ACFFCW_38015 [Candidatus Hodarchaeota archaeon]
MNSKQNNKTQEQNTEKLKEIPKWTRLYAENRTLPFLVNMLTFLFLFLCNAGLIYIAGKAFRSRNMPLFWISIFSVVVVVTATIWLSKLIEKRLYRREGQIKLEFPEKTKRQRTAGMIAGLLFGACVLISITLGVLGYIPIKYMQPISAIYVIPFIISMGIWPPSSINPAGSVVWLWPTLYAIHAILIIAGVPIHFERPWIFLNILIPIAGYGILCGLIGHIYSRYALKKLKTTAHLQENTDE